jgi:hypothetical protein
LIGRKSLLAALLLAVVLAAYAPGLDNDFVGDDLEWARFALRVSHDPRLILSLFSGFVTPAMNVTVGLDALAGGTSAWVYNLTGLLFHLFNVVLLFLLLLALLEEIGPEPLDESASLALGAAAWWGALWWGLNYRHDEAVFWLGGRPHVLVITGILLALHLHRRWLAGGGVGWLVATMAAGEWAILSKESGVMVAPIAAAWVVLVAPRASPGARRRRWAGPLALGLLGALHAAVLLAVRGQHQFYYKVDMSWLGRLAGSHLEAAGIPAGDPPSAWLVAPAAILWALLWWKGGRLARFGLVVMLLGTLPTVLIEFQPPRYRYFPLLGAACVLVALLGAALRRGRLPPSIAFTMIALSCLYLAAGVRNDEVFLDQAGRIHRAVRDAFCAAESGVDRTVPLAVVWRPAVNGVNALRAAANRDVAIPIRNFVPIYVRASGIEGLAEVETLASLCEDGRDASSIRRLPPDEAAATIRGGRFSLIDYEPGGFRREDLEARRRLEDGVSGAAPAEILADGRRWAVLDLAR